MLFRRPWTTTRVRHRLLLEGVAGTGYVSRDLRQVLGQEARGRYSRTYCGKGVLATCRADVLASLHATGSAVLKSQSKSDLAALTYDKRLDFIRSAIAGVVGVRGIDWQNRPTCQQAVKFLTHCG